MDKQQRQLTKKKRQLLMRQQRERERSRYQRQQKLKKFLWITIIILITAAIIGGIWLLATRPSPPGSAIISRQGIHWHAELTITVLGQYQEIPGNTGIGTNVPPTHTSIHTHEADGNIHMEFSGRVKEEDIQVSRFFEIWGRKFSAECIFDNCNGPEGTVKMLVNGEPNFEFGNYIMRNADSIEIIFEK